MRDVLAAISVIPAPAPVRPVDPVWRAAIGRPVGRFTRVVTIGALPPTLAERLGLALTAEEERRLRRFVVTVAGLQRSLPPPLRPGPAAALMQWRSRRRWERAGQPNSTPCASGSSVE